jgi:hypothetical protein
MSEDQDRRQAAIAEIEKYGMEFQGPEYGSQYSIGELEDIALRLKSFGPIS